MIMKKLLIFICFGFSLSGFAYKIAPKDIWVGGGMGGIVNVARYERSPDETPKGGLALMGTVNYALDSFLGAYGSLNPQFLPDAFSLGIEGGAKYWFSYFNTPYFPYISAGLSTALMFTDGSRKNHFNIGLAAGAGLNFFITGNFLAGVGIKFYPTVGFIGSSTRFEFSTLGFLEIAFKI